MNTCLSCIGKQRTGGSVLVLLRQHDGVLHHGPDDVRGRVEALVHVGVRCARCRRGARRRAGPGRCGGCAPSPRATRAPPSAVLEQVVGVELRRDGVEPLGGAPHLLERAGRARPCAGPAPPRRRASGPATYSPSWKRFAWMKPIGLLISCATPAASCPIDAIFSVCSTWRWSCLISDRSWKITTAPRRAPSRSTSGAHEVPIGTRSPSRARDQALGAAEAHALARACARSGARAAAPRTSARGSRPQRAGARRGCARPSGSRS